MGYRTGGVELLHQLVFELKQNNIPSQIAYLHNSKNGIIPEYKKYIDDYVFVNEIEDSKDTLLIIPENFTWVARQFSLCEKAIWWLSLDNYLKRKDVLFATKKYGLLQALKIVARTIIGKNIQLNSQELSKIQYHFVQSHYVKEYLAKIGVQSYFLTDYLNAFFFEKTSGVNKENIVVFNPSKGIKVTQKIIKMNKDIVFVPIAGMTTEEVRDLLDRAKVYIDFGEFPGKDRIPREAAMRFCCIICGRDGASKNEYDFSLPKEYKVDKNNKEIKQIRQLILKCINNYDNVIKDFEHYRNTIMQEERIFKEEVLSIFGARHE